MDAARGWNENEKNSEAIFFHFGKCVCDPVSEQ
jgi:hypothetical protein